MFLYLRKTSIKQNLIDRYRELQQRLDGPCRALLDGWPEQKRRYAAEKYQFEVRGRVIEQDLYTKSLSHLLVPKVDPGRITDPEIATDA